MTVFYAFVVPTGLFAEVERAGVPARRPAKS